MNQDQFAALAGVQRRAQSNYERGERFPDAAYLAKIAAHGADVAYILTGQRTLTAAEVDQAAQRMADAWEALDRALLQHPRFLTPAQKRKAAQTLYSADKAPPATVNRALLIALALQLSETDGD